MYLGIEVGNEESWKISWGKGNILKHYIIWFINNVHSLQMT
jgi:hypothetical protein